MAAPASTSPRSRRDTVVRGLAALGLLCAIAVGTVGAATTLFSAYLKAKDAGCPFSCELQCAGIPQEPQAWYCDRGCTLCACRRSCATSSDCPSDGDDAYDCVPGPLTGRTSCVPRAGVGERILQVVF